MLLEFSTLSMEEAFTRCTSKAVELEMRETIYSQKARLNICKVQFMKLKYLFEYVAMQITNAM